MHTENQTAELALKRYDIVMAHLRYDNTVFWTRFGFMLVSEVAMLGIFINVFLATRQLPAYVSLASCLLLCAVGLILVQLFESLRAISAWWIGRWLMILRDYESHAFNEVELVRNVKAPKRLGTPSTRKLAAYFMYLFAVIWVMAATATIIRALI